MNVPTAQKYARQIVLWLAPFTERIFIAGSIRRERPECADVDLVVIPKRGEKPDLFGAELGSSLLYRELTRYVEAKKGAAHWKVGVENPNGKQYVLQLPKCQLDIYTATPENWGSILVCRTGSKEHNTWMSERFQSLGKEWKLQEGIVVDGHVRRHLNEHTFYAEALMNFIPPNEREAGRLERYIMQPHEIAATPGTT